MKIILPGGLPHQIRLHDREFDIQVIREAVSTTNGSRFLFFIVATQFTPTGTNSVPLSGPFQNADAAMYAAVCGFDVPTAKPGSLLSELVDAMKAQKAVRVE